VIGPSFSASEVADVVEALLETYKSQRLAGETFIGAVRRIGLPPFRDAANRVRHETGNPDEAHNIRLKTADALTD
jgi:sulfite reductase (NADPH) hemoprotein beta-component